MRMPHSGHGHTMWGSWYTTWAGRLRASPRRRNSASRHAISSAVAGSSVLIVFIIWSLEAIMPSIVPQPNRHVLRLHISFQPLMSQLTSEPALFHAAEGALRHGGDRFFYADDAGLQSLGHAPGHGQVVGEDIRRQAIAGVVG